MKLHRFYCQEKFDPDLKINLNDRDLVNQIKNVLRMKPQDKLVLFGGESKEVLCEVVNIDEGRVELKVLEVSKNENEPDRKARLYLSILKKENFELAVQKAVETGVSEIVPLICERTVKTGLKKDRLEKIIKEASEQSGRGIIPELYDPIKFEEAVNRIDKNNLSIIFDSSGKDFQNLKLDAYSLKLSLFVGPEGGWTDAEIKLAKDNGFEVVSLGRTTLRAETAAIVGTYLSTWK